MFVVKNYFGTIRYDNSSFHHSTVFNILRNNGLARLVNGVLLVVVLAPVLLSVYQAHTRPELRYHDERSNFVVPLGPQSLINVIHRDDKLGISRSGFDLSAVLPNIIRISVI